MHYLETVERWCMQAGAGRVASVVGRYFAMDRDHRWERTQAAYDLLVQGQADYHTVDGAQPPVRRTAAVRQTSSSPPRWWARRV